VNAAGGLKTMLVSLPAEHLNIVRPSWLNILAWIVSGAGMRIIATHNVAAMYAARDVKNAQIGGVSAALFYVFFACLTCLIGLATYVVMPDIPSKLALWEIGKYNGAAVSTIISIGVMAAITSTTPMIWLGLASMATRDVFLVLKPRASERAQLAFCRIFVLVVAFPSTWFALTQPSILGFLLKMIQTQFPIQILFIIAVLWRRPHPTAAFWSIIMGSTGGITWFLAGSPFGLEPLWPGAAIGILTLLITSLRNRPSPFKGAQELNLALETERG
jgi:Na+/proline symporter